MARIIQVFVKGDAYTPSRFWSYALRTETKHGRLYDSLGYVYCKKSTREFIAMTEQERGKVTFTYINGKYKL